jgi:hypothetical protein
MVGDLQASALSETGKSMDPGIPVAFGVVLYHGVYAETARDNPTPEKMVFRTASLSSWMSERGCDETSNIS